MEPSVLVDEKRLQKDFDALRELSKDPEGGVTRLAYTEAETKAHGYVAAEARKIGLTATTDAIGNLYVKLGGGHGRTIRIGSHLDSVNNGGNYDGAVGVLTGLEALRCLAQAKAQLRYPVELVAFRAEESARFNRGCIASEIATGGLKIKEAKAIRDSDGVTLYDAIKKCGYNPDKLEEAKWDKSGIKLFIEPHIEQGRVLEAKKVPVGIVTGIAAPVRHIVNIKGRTDHSGATPMNMRLDAVAAAAEMILAAEATGKEAFNAGKATVATVGMAIVPQGSINKVAGKAALYLDVRDASLTDRNYAEKTVLQRFKEIAKRRGVNVTTEETQRSKPAVTGKEVADVLLRACKKLKAGQMPIVSGAAQDSMHISNYGIPTGMIFVPSRNGISHAPAEFTEMKHIATAAKIVVTAIMDAQQG